MSDVYRIPITAGADLRAQQWKAIIVAGTIATNAQTSAGILADKPDNGQNGSLNYLGVSKFAAGGAVAAGDEITVSSGGWLTVATSGDRVVGHNFGPAVSSGMVGERAMFNFAAKGYKNV